jgi:serine/threonine protein kinase
MHDLTNQHLGDYQLHEEIGRGGMAVVYRASHPAYGAVAFKVLPAYFVHQPDALRRFLHESRAVGALHHPNIVQLYEADSLPDPTMSGGRVHFIAMEYIGGGSLLDRLQQAHTIDQAALVQVGIEIGYALEYAHQKGFIHRDIKPSNILFRPDGRMVLADFGIALAADQSRVTQTGGFAGTIAYLAPEVAQGSPATPRSDIYALALILYEGLTGENPFSDTTSPPLVALNRIVNSVLPPIQQVSPSVPALLAEIVDRGTARDPQLRPASAGAFVNALQQARVGRSSAPLNLPTQQFGPAAPAYVAPPPAAVTPAPFQSVRGATPIPLSANRAVSKPNLRIQNAARKLPAAAIVSIGLGLAGIIGIIFVLLAVTSGDKAPTPPSGSRSNPIIPTSDVVVLPGGGFATVTLAPAQATAEVQTVVALPPLENPGTATSQPPTATVRRAVPTAAPQPTATVRRAAPTAVPVRQPTAVSEPPTNVPVRPPTAVPEQPTGVPEQPTGVPEPPTAVPEAPTNVPDQPTEDTDLDNDGTPNDRDDCDYEPGPTTNGGCPLPTPPAVPPPEPTPAPTEKSVPTPLP